MFPLVFKLGTHINNDDSVGCYSNGGGGGGERVGHPLQLCNILFIKHISALKSIKLKTKIACIF